jgi:hypothetical protein
VGSRIFDRHFIVEMIPRLRLAAQDNEELRHVMTASIHENLPHVGWLK